MSFGWITHPHGTSIRARLPMKRRSGLVPDSAVLLAWAEELFRQGLELRKTRCPSAIKAVIAITILATAPNSRPLVPIGIHASQKIS